MKNKYYFNNKLNNLYLDAKSKELVQIICADIYYHSASVRYLNDGSITDWDEDYFELIPISEEILIAIGFEKHNSTEYHYKIGDNGIHIW